MARLPHTTGSIPLVAGITAATALTGAAVLTVVQSGCDNPGYYRVDNGVVELVGGCITEKDLPVAPQTPRTGPRQLGEPANQPPVRP